MGFIVTSEIKFPQGINVTNAYCTYGAVMRRSGVSTVEEAKVYTIPVDRLWYASLEKYQAGEGALFTPSRVTATLTAEEQSGNIWSTIYTKIKEQDISDGLYTADDVTDDL